MRIQSLAWFMACLLVCAHAGAQEATPSAERTDAEARAIFEAGEVAFTDGRFDEALAHFEESYRLSERPALLFNVGLAAYRARLDDRALEAFERFLELLPDHENARQARGRIRTIRQQQAQQREATEGEEAETEMNDAPSPRSRTGAWILGIGGGVVALSGTVLLAVALSTKSDVESQSDPQWSDIADDVDAVPVQSGVGITLIAAGSAAAIGAVLWRVLTPDSPVQLSASSDRLVLAGQF